MFPKQQNQYGFFALSKKKISNDKKSQNKGSKCSRDDGSIVSTVSTESAVFDDDMSGSLRASSLHKPNTQISATKIQSNCDSLNSLLSYSINSSLRSRSSSRGRKIMKRFKRKKVVFDDNKIQWNFYESFVSDPSDIWWSKEEVKQRQIDNSRVLLAYNRDELHRILQYSNAYHNARQKSVISKHQQESSSIEISSKVNISKADYKFIVRGKTEGWDGLEKVLACNDKTTILSPSDNIVMTRRLIVTIIIASYRDIIHNNSNKFMDESSRKSNSNELDRQIRSISKSLTSCDRSWAVIMGNADRDALLES